MLDYLYRTSWSAPVHPFCSTLRRRLITVLSTFLICRLIISFPSKRKINPIQTNQTQTPEVFLDKLLPILQDYSLIERTTHQSFDWRAIKLSKEKMPQLATAALISPSNLHERQGEPDATSGPSDWLAGIDVNSFDGETEGERIAQAAHSIKADRLAASAGGSDNPEALDPTFEDYDWFTTPVSFTERNSSNSRSN